MYRDGAFAQGSAGARCCRVHTGHRWFYMSARHGHMYLRTSPALENVRRAGPGFLRSEDHDDRMCGKAGSVLIDLRWWTCIRRRADVRGAPPFSALVICCEMHTNREQVFFKECPSSDTSMSDVQPARTSCLVCPQDPARRRNGQAY